MHKFSLIFIALITLTTPINADTPDKKLHEECLYPVVRIRNYDEKSYGTGTIVRSDKINDKEFRNVILSCAHLGGVDDKYSVEIFTYSNWSRIKDSEKFTLKIYASNEQTDLAIGVFISDKKMPTATIDFNTDYYIGNKVFRIGCGSLDYPRLDYGTLTTIRENLYEPYLRTSIYTVAGDSGSPLFHDYKVIGVMYAIRTFRNEIFEKISYAVPVTELKTWSEKEDEFLNFSWDNKKELPKFPYLKLKMEEYTVN